MGALAELKELYAYNRWANARILDAVGELSESDLSKDLGSSFPSVRATVAHLLAAEWIWVCRWEGSSPRGLPDDWADDSVDGVRERWRQVEERQQAFLGTLREADLDRRVDYTDTAGEPLQSTIQQMLRHVVNHASYHRGQVVTMLRQLGTPAPSTDLIFYYRTAQRALA
jgi:uncharacterized damage-inducible protein DinB